MLAGELFKHLAKGIHPETGGPLPPDSLVHQTEAIRRLFLLTDEFNDMRFRQAKRMKKVKLTPEERRQKNRNAGRSANASEEEKRKLAEHFNGKYTIPQLERFERSPRSIALQLVKMKRLTAEEAARYE